MTDSERIAPILEAIRIHPDTAAGFTSIRLMLSLPLDAPVPFALLVTLIEIPVTVEDVALLTRYDMSRTVDYMQKHQALYLADGVNRSVF